MVKFTASQEDEKVVCKVLETLVYDENKPMVDLMNFNLAPETMRLDEDGNIVFKENVFGGGKGLTDQFHFAEWAIDGTVKFSCHSNIYEIIFNYMEGDQYREYASIFQYGTTKFDGSFETALEKALPHILEVGNPTTWEEEDPEIFANLTTLLGDYASQIPYVYDVNFSGNYTSSVYSATTVYIKVPISTPYSDSYKAAFIAACEENGFTKNSEKKATKAMGDKSIIVQFLSSTLAVQYK